MKVSYLSYKFQISTFANIRIETILKYSNQNLHLFCFDPYICKDIFSLLSKDHKLCIFTPSLFHEEIATWSSA